MTTPDAAPTSTSSLTYTRVLAAPRELVFQCLIDPAHLTHFWGPSGTSTPLSGIRIDPRPGGAFETTMVSDADGSSYTMRAVYDEITPPERIVWTDPGNGMQSVSTLVDLGGGRTELTIEQRNAPEGFGSPAARAGFTTSLEKFQRYVEALRESADRS